MKNQSQTYCDWINQYHHLLIRLKHGENGIMGYLTETIYTIQDIRIHRDLLLKIAVFCRLQVLYTHIQSRVYKI